MGHTIPTSTAVFAFRAETPQELSRFCVGLPPRAGEALRETLTGHRRVKVLEGWGGPWGVLLATIADETPDATASRTAVTADDVIRAGQRVELQVLPVDKWRALDAHEWCDPAMPTLSAALGMWSRSRPSTVESAVALLKSEGPLTQRVEREASRGLAPAAAIKRLTDQRDEVRRRAATEVSELAARGLGLRKSLFLQPDIVLGPADVMEWAAWQAVRTIVAKLGATLPLEMQVCDGRSAKLQVCDGCSVVFEAKTVARYCRLCRARPAAKPLYEALHAVERRGDTAAARVAVTRGSVVTAWRQSTVGRCSECGALLFGRADQRTCSGAHRNRRHRRSS